MLAVLPGRQKQDFPIPDRMVNMEIDRLSGYAAHDSYPSRPEYFIDGTQPRINDPVHLRLKICKGSGGLAPPEDVASGNFEDKEYIKLSEEDPVSTDGRNRWQEGIENWILTQPNQDLYRPPGEYCRSGGMVGADIYHPGDHATVGNSIDVKITTTSTKKVTELKMWVDGIETKTWSEKPFEMNINLTDGPHVIRVKATDKDGNSVERESHFGVNVPWDWSPSPTPTVTPLPSNTPTPTVILPTPTILISGT